MSDKGREGKPHFCFWRGAVDREGPVHTHPGKGGRVCVCVMLGWRGGGVEEGCSRA